MRRLAVALVVTSPIMAQAVSFGVRGGFPLTPALQESNRQADQYIAGALVELHLVRGVSLGADFLFHHADLAFTGTEPRSATMWQWQAPVTLVYRFGSRLSPFLRGGVAFSRIFDISGVTKCGRGPFGEQFYCTPSSAVIELRHKGTYGFVVGGGLSFRLKAISLEPELRLTRWVDRNFGTRESSARSTLNQVGLLLGIRY